MKTTTSMQLQKERQMFNKNLAPIVDLMINSLGEHSNEFRAQFGRDRYSSFIREYRTVDLRVPRQTGKTSILINKMMEQPSIMFVHNVMARERLRPIEHLWGSNVHTRPELDYLDRIRAKYYSRLELQFECLMVDEPAFYTKAQESNLNEFIDFLHGRQLVTDNFYVLKLGT